MLKKFMKFVLAGGCILGFAQGAQAYALLNGGFENPSIASGGSAKYEQLAESSVPDWKTTASDGLIELWANGFRGVTSYEGNQHAELNATQASTLFQDVSGITAGTIVGYEFAHRGRSGEDTMRFTLTDLGSDGIFGSLDDTSLFTNTFTDGADAWRFYTGTGIEALGNTIRFSYEAVSAAGGSSIGNFLDAAAFGVGAGENTTSVPTPASVWLFGFGIFCLGLGFVARNRRGSVGPAA